MLDQVQVAYQFVLKHMAAPKPENHSSRVMSNQSQVNFAGQQIHDQSLQNSSHSILTPSGWGKSWVTPHLFRKLWGQWLGKGGKLSRWNGKPKKEWPLNTKQCLNK